MTPSVSKAEAARTLKVPKHPMGPPLYILISFPVEA